MTLTPPILHDFPAIYSIIPFGEPRHRMMELMRATFLAQQHKCCVAQVQALEATLLATATEDSATAALAVREASDDVLDALAAYDVAESAAMQALIASAKPSGLEW